MAEACLKHSNLFKVKDPTTCPPLNEEGSKSQEDRRTTPGTHACNHGGPGRSHQKSNYELFNCSNFNIRYWSWNYRGCWPFLNTGLKKSFIKYLYFMTLTPD